jgi:tetratricopeptide (TPR) repeat protein
MSIFASFTKKSKLDASIRQTTQARKNEGAKADQLFNSAYQGYADVLHDDPLRAAALYHWGFTLLHQAKTKSGEEAIKLYEESIAKFSFCMLIDPNYLGAAIDCGVAYMDLARIKGVDVNDELYEMARNHFEKANSIQAGTASYNLACIYGLRGDSEACLNALQNSRDKGSLPDAQDILNDPDLAGVKNQGWFLEFMESLNEKKEAVAPKALAAEEASTEEKPE